MVNPNARFFRYSDRVNEILVSAPGDTLDEKFENLVLYCFDYIKKNPPSGPTEEQLRDKARFDYERRRTLTLLNIVQRDLEDVKKKLERAGISIEDFDNKII